MNLAPTASPLTPALPAQDAAFGSELRLLFHRLNNQLGIILAHAELLEAKATDGATRARAWARTSSRTAPTSSRSSSTATR